MAPDVTAQREGSAIVVGSVALSPDSVLTTGTVEIALDNSSNVVVNGAPPLLSGLLKYCVNKGADSYCTQAVGASWSYVPCDQILPNHW